MYWRCRTSTAIAAVGAAMTVLTATAAWGHANGWISASEGGPHSSEAIESASSKPDRPNLCEGINGIPTGGDPGWTRTNGSPDPNTPFVEARGQVLPDLSYKTNPFVTHTDAPFNHYSHDINVFVTLDKGFRNLLASGNFEYFADLDDPVPVENEHSMLELEWERSGVPFFAYPSQSDRITAWGPHVWDCGHGQAHGEIVPGTNPPEILLHPVAFRTEIHSPVGWVSFRNTAAKSDRDQTPPPGKADQDPWVWYEASDHQGVATTLPSTALKNTPVQATVADAFFSTFGGNIPESINGCDDSTLVSDDTINADCLSPFGDDFEWAQPLLNQDYSFFVPAPPRPSAGSTLVWESVDRCGEVPHSPGNPPGDNVEDVSEADDGAENIGAPTCNIPDQVVETTENGQPGVRVTVKALTSDATYPSNSYVAFAKTYKVAWDEAKPDRPRVFNVAYGQLRVFDDTEDQGNDGEWVVSLTANERWIHPVRGSGDDNDPFWENGALDDGCDDDDACGYNVGHTFTGIGVVPGETLNVKMRGWDDDTTFIQDNDVNEILPVVNVFHPLSELPGSFNKRAQNMVATTDGDYSLAYNVTETTPAPPTAGTLTIGDPKQGPIGDTFTITPATPLTYGGSDGTELQYRFWLDGSPKPSVWQTDSSAPFNVSLAGAGAGRYTIEYRPVSAGGVVGITGSTFVQLLGALSIGDISIVEGDRGSKVATFTVTTSLPSPSPVTVEVTTAPGTASVDDYFDPNPFLRMIGVGGPARIPAGQTTGTYSVNVAGDLRFEPDETVIATLSAPAGALVVDGTGVLTIVNDDHVSEVTGLSPNHGPSTGGSQVTIEGHNLDQVSAVSIGGVGVPFVVSSPSLVITTPGALPGEAAVVVTGPDGNSKTHPGSIFTYL